MCEDIDVIHTRGILILCCIDDSEPHGEEVCRTVDESADLSCLLLLGLLAASAPEPDQAPSYLVGVWETHTKGHADQHKLIDQGRIGSGTSVVAENGYVITKVDESHEAGKTLFVLSYQDADQVKFQLGENSLDL